MQKNLEELFIYNFRSVFLQAKSLCSSLNQCKKIFNDKNELTQNTIETHKDNIDLLLYRFSKLQDLLAQNVFKGILTIEMEPVNTIIDVLNKMEQRLIIEDSHQWRRIRERRNIATHEYPHNADEIIKAIREIYEFTPELIKIVCNVKLYVENNLKISLSDFDLNEIKVNQEKKCQ